MRRLLLGPLFTAIATVAVAAPMPKEQLSTPAAGARHYTISSTAGKHGDVWSWTRPDGRVAYRMSMSLRGWVTEEDELVTVGSDRRPTAIAIRGSGLELVRELELYEKAGLSNAESLQTATIIPARMTGMADRTGSIAPGKTADIILVEGDVSKDLANLRHVDTVFLDGYRLGGKELRKASGLTGMPK
jgi:hypothetical protein